MNKIAVFGGSFDPVHLSHAKIAINLAGKQDIHKIIFVPSYTLHYNKKQVADINQRISMLNLAIKDIPKSEISLFESDKKTLVYSYQTLDYFKSIYPEFEICMVIGSDSLDKLHTWKNIDYISAKYKFIVAKRPGITVDANLKYLRSCIFLDYIMEDISSTQIKKLFKENNANVKELLNEEVYKYIKENGLYK